MTSTWSIGCKLIMRLLWAEQAVNRQPVKSRGAIQYDERNGDHADRSKDSATAPRAACRSRASIPAVGAGGTERRSILHHGAKRRSQYICILRDLQVAGCTGFSSAAGLHQEIPDDAKVC